MGDDFAVINSLSLIFHECKKNMLFSPRCVSCAGSECVRIFLCLAAQEKSLGASVAEGGGHHWFWLSPWLGKLKEIVALHAHENSSSAPLALLITTHL